MCTQRNIKKHSFHKVGLIDARAVTNNIYNNNTIIPILRKNLGYLKNSNYDGLWNISDTLKK